MDRAGFLGAKKAVCSGLRRRYPPVFALVLVVHMAVHRAVRSRGVKDSSSAV